MANKYDIAIIGGGAAGYYAAIQAAESNPSLKIIILERASRVLQKVKISGGGRCNVTNACWDPKELAESYPRGNQELLGPFHKYYTGDVVAWFEEKGIDIKEESDGRMFPVSDSSQTIIDCFENAIKEHQIEVSLKSGVEKLSILDESFKLKLKNDAIYAHRVLVAAGSSKGIWQMLSEMGHKIIKPVPSLFTFNCKDTRLRNLAGVSVDRARVEIPKLNIEMTGPLLVTHWGLSGPAILKLSAYGARNLFDIDYKFKLRVNFTDFEFEEVKSQLETHCQELGKKQISNSPKFNIPKRLWQSLLGSQFSKPAQKLTESEIEKLTALLVSAEFSINGKSTFKDEFVTAGGLSLAEVDFRTMESRKFPNLFFAGEVLDIDAITGGFNFQAAWTTAYLAAQAMSKP